MDKFYFMKLHIANKKIGQTPLEALEALRKKKKIPAQVSLTYAGRLDPMASGVLLILENASQQDREKYLGLGKTYEAKILLGFTTDTWDLLGMPQVMQYATYSKEQIARVVKKYLGTIKLPVPAYSSVQYKGKSLFEWARAGKLKEKDLPKKEMGVFRLRQGFGGSSKSVEWISSGKLLKYIQTNIKKVKGDFRQEEILKVWHDLLVFPSLEGRVLSPRITNKYQIVNITISVGSGTYIRSMAHDLGKKLGTGAVLFSLKRTRVGRYNI